MESYVIRIYRRHEAEPEQVIGLVEYPEQGTVERFNGATELMRILLTPTKSAEIVAVSEEKKKPAPPQAGEQQPAAETAGITHQNTRACAAEIPRKTDFHSATPNSVGTRVFFLAEARSLRKP